jgi:ferredoxin
VRVRIDTDACQGHSRCALRFPEIFDVDDDAKAFVLLDNPGPEWAEQIQSAIANCPERAISLDTEGEKS